MKSLFAVILPLQEQMSLSAAPYREEGELHRDQLKLAANTLDKLWKFRMGRIKTDSKHAFRLLRLF